MRSVHAILPTGQVVPVSVRGIAVNHRVRARAKFFFEGDHKFFLKGVTYGTFAPDADGYYVGPPEKARLDLSMMREIGVNGVRVYHAPPKWFLDLAYEFGVRVMVTLWWGQNVDFLRSGKRRREIFEKVDSDVKSECGTPRTLRLPRGQRNLEHDGPLVRRAARHRVRRKPDQHRTRGG